MYNIKKYLKIEEIEPTITNEEYLKSYMNRNNSSILDDNIEKIIQQEKLYKNLASTSELHKLESIVINDDHLKKVLTNLYKNQLSKTNHHKNKKYYNEIVKIAKNGKCPYCSIGHVFSGNATLDHFLPKSKFPELSVSFINLVPCCTDCNKNKGEIFNKDEKQQFIQPYFDNISSKKWLYVEFTNDFRHLNYIVKNENNINPIIIERIKFQFTQLKIYEKYQIQAIDELNEKLNICKSDNSKITALLKEFNDSYNRITALNSWKKSLYDTLRKFSLEDCQNLIENFK